MKLEDIARRRLQGQRLIGPPFAKPEDAVRALGAVQSQDLAGAKWALGRRTRNATDAAIETALDEGRILRTHVLRPTWHFVVPEDLRWMAALTAPRVRMATAYYDRQLELDARALGRAHEIIARALEGGKHLTRVELGRLLTTKRVEPSGQRLAHIMMHAELDALVCSGVRRGKQTTYALVDERIGKAKGTMAPDEAAAELARRFFGAHGPATLRDFAWWSGLSLTQAKGAVGALGREVTQHEIEGVTYVLVAGSRSPATSLLERSLVQLLPNYDEYVVAYQDRAVVLDEGVRTKLSLTRGVLDAYIIIAGGRVAGGWRRTLGKTTVAIEGTLLVDLSADMRAALDAEVARFGSFLGLTPSARFDSARGPR